MPGWQAEPGRLRFAPSSVMGRGAVLAVLCTGLCSGCAVVSVAGAAVTVVSTTVSVGASVVGTGVDVATAGVKAVVGSDASQD